MPGKEDDANTNITNSDNQRSDDNHIPEVLFIAMGQAQFFDTWYSNLSQFNYTTVRLSFLYGAYDSPLPPESESNFPCQENRSLSGNFESCKFHFIPKTTWTQGRNILAGDALLLERKRRKKFDYWIFADDDVSMVCSQPELSDPWVCMKTYLEFLGTTHGLSRKFLSFAPTGYIDEDGYCAVSTQDALLASFRREIVPYLLPYANLQKGESEWLSQGALFCLMRTCFRSSIITPPNLGIANPLHREYERGIDQKTLQAVVRNNYGTYMNLEHCAKTGYDQLADWIGPYATIEELIDEIPYPNLAYCAPLRDRFAKWEQKVYLSEIESIP